MKPKCETLEWSATSTRERVTVAMSFVDFDQSQRFVALLIKFIQDERGKPDDIMPECAWYCPPIFQQTPGV